MERHASSGTRRPGVRRPRRPADRLRDLQRRGRGRGRPTVLFVPIDSCVQSRAWKAQVPYLAQHYRVVTIDPRGNGRSDRPTDPAEYGDLDFVADTVAVMDAAGVDRAVLVGICVSAWQAMLVASLHAERVQGVVAIGPWLYDDTPPLPFRAEAAAHFEDELPSLRGLDDGQPALPPDGLAGVLRVLLRPDAVRTALDQAAGGHPRVDRRHDRAGAARGPGRRQVPRRTWRTRRRCCARSTQPVLVIRGTEDRCQPLGRAEKLAAWTGGELLELEGSGHLPMARDPITVNRAIKGFVDRVTGAPAPARPRRGRHEASAAGALPLLAHRARPRAPRPGHRRRDARAAARPRGPVADPVAGGGVPRAARRGRAPGLAPAGERVRALRVGVGRARPARVPGRAPDGRGAGQQLHGVRRPGGAGGVRRLAGRRGLGPRPLPAREPRAQAGAVRLDDRLRRVGADARRR